MCRCAARALSVGFTCVAVLLASTAWAADPAPATNNPFGEAAAVPAQTAAAKIRAALGETTKLQVIEMPLRKVVHLLQDMHGIGLQLDEPAMIEAGIDPEGVMTLDVHGIPLASALRLLLRPLDMTYTIRDEVLLITTEDAAAGMTELRAYNVGETLDLPSGGVRELAGTLKSIFEQEHGPFEAVPFYNFLIVKTSQHKHEELVRLLDAMKDKLAFEPPKQ